jgi:hypothetical protein
MQPPTHFNQTPSRYNFQHRGLHCSTVLIENWSLVELIKTYTGQDENDTEMTRIHTHSHYDCIHVAGSQNGYFLTMPH